MNNKELNEKLAKWVGCEMEYDRVYEKPFTESLDACFKWLVPKLKCFMLATEFQPKYERLLPTKNFCADVQFNFPEPYQNTIRYVACAETPALALCKAIEKLIGNKKMGKPSTKEA